MAKSETVIISKRPGLAWQAEGQACGCVSVYTLVYLCLCVCSCVEQGTLCACVSVSRHVSFCALLTCPLGSQPGHEGAPDGRK